MKLLRPCLTLVAGLALLGLGGCGKSDSGASGKKPRIAFISNGVAAFWTIAEAGVKAAGEKYGATVSVHMPAEGIGDQKRIVEDLLTRGVDGMAISPIDPVNQTDLLNKAAGLTKLVTHDSDAPEANRLVYIGMDNYKAGRMCGALIKEALPNGGKIMILVGRLEQDNARRRRQGVIDELLGRPEDPTRFDPPGAMPAGNNFTIVGTMTDQFDRAKAKANAEDALARHPDLAGMVGLFAYNPPLILEALSRAGKVGQVKLIAFDEDDGTLQGIKDGHIHGTVVQNPYMYGYKSVEVLSELLKGNTTVIPAGKFIDIPARQIRKDSVEEFWTDLKAKTARKG
ncbi:MAG: D-ribose-binding periplasmic protein precursor [Verrucomicrobiota bacterium]|jgi:ribose transport system substrate-binding protein